MGCGDNNRVIVDVKGLELPASTDLYGTFLKHLSLVWKPRVRLLLLTLHGAYLSYCRILSKNVFIFLDIEFEVFLLPGWDWRLTFVEIFLIRGKLR